MPRAANHRTRGRCGLLSLGVLLAMLTCAGPAFADSATLNVLTTDGKSDPAAGVARVFSVTGTAAVNTKVWVKYRATGGAPCAPSFGTDAGAYQITDKSGGYFYGTAVQGTFDVKLAGTWDGGVGAYQFCIWIAATESTIVTPITQNITFRAPGGTISGTLNPISPSVNQETAVTITGSSESPKKVYATVRTAGGAGCAQTYDADAGTGILTGTAVNGSFSVQATTKQSVAGNYVLCLWLANSSSDTAPIAGPQPVPFTVQPPPPVDADRDGSPLPQDCNDTSAAVRPGLPEIADNDIDENCDGVVARRVRATTTVTIGRRGSRYRGRVAATSPACVGKRRVVLRRSGSGKKSFGSTTTRADGTWSISRGRRLRGRVYAVAAPRASGLTICGVGTSPIIRG